MNHHIFVRGILYDHQGRVLALKEARECRPWNLPGGRVEVGEAPSDALVREVYEELGLVITNYSHLKAGEFQFSGVEWVGHFFKVQAYEGIVSIREPSKCSAVGFFTLRELCELPADQHVFSEIVKGG